MQQIAHLLVRSRLATEVHDVQVRLGSVRVLFEQASQPAFGSKVFADLLADSSRQHGEPRHQIVRLVVGQTGFVFRSHDCAVLGKLNPLRAPVVDHCPNQPVRRLSAVRKLRVAFDFAFSLLEGTADLAKLEQLQIHLAKSRHCRDRSR